MEKWLRRQDAAVERVALRMRPETLPARDVQGALSELLDIIENGRDVPEDLKERISLLRLRIRHSKLVGSVHALTRLLTDFERKDDE
jgi:hypothetical protein